MEEIPHNPKDVWAWINQTNMAADQGNKEKARQCLLNAVKLDPTSVQAWNTLSYFAGSRQEEIKALKKVLELEPGNKNAAERLRKVESDTFQLAPSEKLISKGQ